MEAANFAAGNSFVLTALIALLGCAIGSFLNVVCLRLPRMMEREWRAQCAEISGTPAAEEEPLNLAFPPSRCPQCGHVRICDFVGVDIGVLLNGNDFQIPINHPQRRILLF